MSNPTYIRKAFANTVGVKDAYVLQQAETGGYPGAALREATTKYLMNHINGFTVEQVGQMLQWLYDNGAGNSGIDKLIPSFKRVSGKAVSY